MLFYMENKKSLIFFQGESLNNLQNPPTPLDETSIMKLKSVFEIHCVVSGESQAQKATLFLGLGVRAKVYYFSLRFSILKL